MGKARRILLVLGVLALVGVLAVVGLYWAARHEPAFYRKALAAERGAQTKASDRMLREITALASALRKPGRWQAEFTAEMINGWLAVDLVENHPNALPREFRDPRVAIDAGGVTVACRYDDAGASSVLSLTVEAYVPEPNVVALRIVKARSGLLPVPLDPIYDGISQAARDMQLHLKWRRGGVALVSVPRGDEERTVRIESVQLADGVIRVVMTTLERKP